MAVLITRNKTLPAVGGAKPDGLASLAASVRGYFQRRARINAAYRELSMLTDRELSDIGASRADIRRIADETP